MASLDLRAGKADRALARYRETKPECFSASTPHERYWSCPEQLVRIWQALGESAKAQQLMQDIWEESRAWREHQPILGNRGQPMYRVGVLALQGEREQALDALEKTVDAGWRGYTDLYFLGYWRWFAEFEITLDAIRDDPRFKAAFARVEADMAGQLKLVRQMERDGEILPPDSLDKQGAGRTAR